MKQFTLTLLERMILESIMINMRGDDLEDLRKGLKVLQQVRLKEEERVAIPSLDTPPEMNTLPDNPKDILVEDLEHIWLKMIVDRFMGWRPATGLQGLLDAIENPITPP